MALHCVALVKSRARSDVQAAGIIRLVQSTGQALSPMVDRIASALDDEPQRKAAIQCAPDATLLRTPVSRDSSGRRKCFVRAGRWRLSATR